MIQIDKYHKIFTSDQFKKYHRIKYEEFIEDRTSQIFAVLGAIVLLIAWGAENFQWDHYHGGLFLIIFSGLGVVYLILCYGLGKAFYYLFIKHPLKWFYLNANDRKYQPIINKYTLEMKKFMEDFHHGDKETVDHFEMYKEQLKENHEKVYTSELGRYYKKEWEEERLRKKEDSKPVSTKPKKSSISFPRYSIRSISPESYSSPTLVEEVNLKTNTDIKVTVEEDEGDQEQSVPEPGLLKLQARKIDWSLLTSKNRELGELISMEYERDRLIDLGLRHRLDDLVHVIKEQGDGLGYDITSLNEAGERIYIEVKSTPGTFNKGFYFSRSEYRSMEIHPKTTTSTDSIILTRKDPKPSSGHLMEWKRYLKGSTSYHRPILFYRSNVT